jgi:tetratricopeptide (TPR) repeat protein/CHAT domain-containing protein
MKSYVVQIFRKTSQSVLRFFDDPTVARPLPQQRPLPPEPIEAFVREVDAEYKKRAPNLADLGQRLYRWLDGPTERWLERIITEPAALHLDVDEGLRHLPWELLSRDGAFVCTNPLRPFTPVRRIASAATLPLFTPAPSPANRPLRILFMASSPTDVAPVLDFEREESLILEATQRHPVELIVEESGTLDGLKQRIEEHASGYYDVFHLTGHADVREGKPGFVLETETGEACFVSADDLARTFSNTWPRLVFLSGCKTGQAVDRGAIPSLSEALVRAGAPAVLGWALPVSDHAASLAAKELYGRLAAGKSIDDAVAYARCKLHEDKIPDWHLLRLYASSVALGALVTPVLTAKRERLRVRVAQKEFLDAGAQMEVCRREHFIGRRRVLQRCLKVLRAREGDAKYAEGVLLHGLGGAGKSSLAARLVDRLPSHRHRFVLVGAVDEIAFLQVMNDRCQEAIEILNRKLPLKARIRQVLEGPLADESALFVFDDFEHNLDRSSVSTGLNPAGLQVIASLLAAIRESASTCRVIVTCQYAFSLPGPARLDEEMLESMRGPELRKKLAQLDHLRPGANGDNALRLRAIELGAGNPRLLERLDKLIAPEDDKALPSARALEETVDTFRKAIFLDGLLKQQTAACRRMLALLSLVNLPVDRATVHAVVVGLVDPDVEKAREVGLVEVAPDGVKGELRFLVPGLVRPVLEEELSGEERKEACGRAARQILHMKPAPEELALEVHRLACEADDKGLAATIGASIAHYWVSQSRFHEAVNICQATLQISSDPRVLHAMGLAEDVIGETTLAKRHFEEALAQYSAISEPDAQDLAFGNDLANSLAILLAREGDVVRALVLWREVLTYAERIGDVKLAAVVIHGVAGVEARRELPDEALILFRKSVSLFEQIGDRKHKAISLIDLAANLNERQQFDEALLLVDEALLLSLEAKDMRANAAAQNVKATILMEQGDIAGATVLWDEAHERLREIGDARGEAQLLYNRAYVSVDHGDVDHALELWGKASDLRAKIGDVPGQVQAKCNMASLLASHDQPGRALELLGEVFALETQGTAKRSIMSVRLKYLKIEHYRYLAPGTRLVFNDTFNVLLGQNGTGKTTLLDLITRIVAGDFSSLKSEAFAIEYQLAYPGLTITAALANDAAKWSSKLTVQIEGLPEAYTIAATPFGTTREISDQSASSTPIRLATPFDAGHFAGALLKVAEIVEPAYQEPLFAAAVLSAQFAENLFRFDEALGGFQIMTGTPPADRSGSGLSARFEFTKNHRLAPGLRAFLPAQLWSRLTALMPELLAAKGGRLPHTEVDFLKKAVDIMHFKEAEMSLRLQKKDVNAGVERLIYGDFEFLFTLRDGSIINQNDLSYGQKRLLAFLYYVAANEHILVADELVNGLHHEWIETCRDEIESRQSFLTSQNPLLLDFLFFSSADDVRKTFILCRQEDRDGRSTMVAENLSEEEAEAFYRAYQTEVQHVSEILRSKGLW